MNELDDKIRDSLRAGAIGGSDEEGVRDMVLATFRGKARWINFAGIAKIIVFACIAVIGAMRFMDAETTRDQIMYSSIFLAGTVCVMGLSVTLWNTVRHNAVLREIKRLEIQVAQLASRVHGEK